MSNSSADLLRTLLFQHNAQSILSIGGSQQMLDLWNICELGDAASFISPSLGLHGHSRV